MPMLVYNEGFQWKDRVKTASVVQLLTYTHGLHEDQTDIFIKVKSIER